ncbi:MAG: MBL fold metallo-hydrolase [Myxococcota bacterium]
MNIELFGHAAIALRWTTTQGTPRTLLIDPYASGGFGGRIGYPPIHCSPDLIVVTHNHSDHNHTQPFPGVPVVGPAQFNAAARSNGGEGLFDATHHPINPVAAGLHLRALEVDHDPFGGRTRGGQSWMVQVVVEGLSIVHSGDIGELPEQHRLRALLGDRPVDLFCVVCGGYYTIGAAEAAELTRRLGARIVLPMHHRTARCTLPGLLGPEPFLARMGRLRKVEGSRVELSAEQVSIWAGSALVLSDHVEGSA